METVTNAATNVTAVASNVATAASKAIWGDAATKDAAKSETVGEEPVSGEVGNVKSGEPYDKGNAETSTEPKSLTNTTSKEIASADSAGDLPSTSKTIDPTPEQKIVPSTTETLDSAAIAPLNDTNTDPETTQAKTGAEEGVAKLSLNENAKSGESKTDKLKENLEAKKDIAAEKVKATTTPSKQTSAEGKEKLSLKDRIKAKLHKN